MVSRALRRRCPRCGDKAFTSWFRMKEHCDRCGLRFEREEGYWVGAVIINTTVTFATFVFVFGSLIAITWPDVPWAVVLAATITANVAIPIVFYPHSRTVWLALELSWHPLETEEVEQAAARAALSDYQIPG